MSISAITCDRCGVVIRDVAERTLLHTMTGPMRPIRPATDLCPLCASAFLAFVEESALAQQLPAKAPAR